MNMFYARLLVIVLVIIGVIASWDENPRKIQRSPVAEMSKSGGL